MTSLAVVSLDTFHLLSLSLTLKVRYLQITESMRLGMISCRMRLIQNSGQM